MKKTKHFVCRKMQEENTIQFYLLISDDTSIRKKIIVKDPQRKNFMDLKKQIQNELGISADKFNLDIDEYMKISNINNKFIKIEWRHICDDICFILPNEKKITINYYSKMDFEKLISRFDDNGYYFSDKCANNLYFQTIGFKIPKTKLKLNFIPLGAKVQVVNENSVSVDIKNKSFYFESGELIAKVEEFIKDKLRIRYVKIHAINPNIKSRFFIIGEKYSVSTSVMSSNSNELTSEDIESCEGNTEIANDKPEQNKSEDIIFDVNPINKVAPPSDSRPKSSINTKQMPIRASSNIKNSPAMQKCHNYTTTMQKCPKCTPIKKMDTLKQPDSPKSAIQTINDDIESDSTSHEDKNEPNFETRLQNQAKEYEMQIENLKKEFELKLENQKSKYEKELKAKNKKIQEKERKEKQQNMQIKNLQDEIDNLKKEKNRQELKQLKILDEETIENFQKVEEIGFGGGGKVFKVIKQEAFALKEMKIQNANVDKFRHFISEYEIMNMMNHPNILKAFGILMTSEKIPPSILLEYCVMNLETAIKKKQFSKERIVTSIYEIAEGMKYIHSLKIIHRDLKPTNILIGKDGMIKIGDFGISCVMSIEEQTLTVGVGTQKFMAPEIINEEEHYNEKVDVYSFGVVVFYILSGGELPKIKVFDILKGKKAELPSSFTDFAKELIRNCWNFKANDRPSFSRIVDMLSENRYKLLEMNENNIENIESFVKEHMKKIPQYGK